jgi:uncharacterized YccA/Bax inhibitor family protein
MTKKKPKKSLPDRPLDKYVRFSGAGLQMAVVIIAFTYGGQYVDESLAMRTPWFTILGSLLGVFISLYLLLRELKNL